MAAPEMTFVPPDDRPRFLRDDRMDGSAIEAADAAEMAAHHATQQQIQEALDTLAIPDAASLRWPYGALDSLTGPLGEPGQIWFVAAFSGTGKTTFVASAIREWIHARKRVYVMALETAPRTFRTYLAAMDLDMSPGDVLSGEAKSWPRWLDHRKALADMITSQATPPMIEYLRVDPTGTIDVAALLSALGKAVAFGADVVVVDHIDHISAEGKQGFALAQSICHAALKFAQKHRLTILFTSQCNLSVLSGRGRMAKYLPPSVNHMLNPAAKLFVATGIVGLFRPFRPRNANGGETEKDYAAAMKAANDEQAEPGTMLLPNTMGLVLMKSRFFGQREGKRIALPLRHGRVTDSPTESPA